MYPISIAALLMAILWIVVIGLCFWLIYWLIGVIAPPEPFRKIALVILAVAAVIICISVLLSLVGHPLFALRP
jgi:hypothetical protein